MGYIYTVLWFITALLLFFKFRKESRIVYVLSGYFIYLGFWWLANQLLEADLMNGIYGWIFRGVSLVMLIILAVVYLLEKRSSAAKTTEIENPQAADTESH